MKIGELSEITSVPQSTVRYYEKIGLLNSARNEYGVRVFCNKDIEWIKFIKRLKETGMPLKSIALYSDLRRLGESSLEARLEMLEEHRDYVLNQIKLWNENLRSLESKIDFYRKSIENAKNIGEK